MSDSDYRPGPLAAVALEPADGRWTLILTRELGHPVKRVWEALTEPGQLRQWAPFTADRDLAGRGDVVLTLQAADGNQAADGAVVLPGTVLQADPPSLLVYRWGSDVLRWDLTSTPDGTVLVLHHTFDDGTMASSFAAGWHICLDVADAMMKDVPFGPVVGHRAREFGWDELDQRYAAAFKTL
jgi:uncharacterized protein YndB with AHSA1/START domain